MSRTREYSVITEQKLSITDGTLYTMLESRLFKDLEDYKLENGKLLYKDRVDHNGYDWVEVPRTKIHPNHLLLIEARQRILTDLAWVIENA